MTVLRTLSPINGRSLITRWRVQTCLLPGEPPPPFPIVSMAGGIPYVRVTSMLQDSAIPIMVESSFLNMRYDRGLSIIDESFERGLLMVHCMGWTWLKILFNSYSCSTGMGDIPGKGSTVADPDTRGFGIGVGFTAGWWRYPPALGCWQAPSARSGRNSVGRGPVRHSG